MAKRQSGQVIQAGGGDVLIFNQSAGDDEGPAGILIPAAAAAELDLDDAEASWDHAQGLVEKGAAREIPVGAFEELSRGLCSITLLMPAVEEPRVVAGAKKKKKAPARGKRK